MSGNTPTKVKSNLDFEQNQALNFVFHNLSSAPATPVEGQPYYNSTSKKVYYWNGTAFVAGALIATDLEASTGTSETVAINPKQLKAAIDGCEPALGYTAENTSNKVTSLSSSSTDTEYPSAKLVYNQLALKAPVASPAFTGTPTSVTPTAGDNSTNIATTAFVQTAISSALTGGLVYKGTWDTTSASDYSALNTYRPIKKGWMFRCSGTGCTIDSVEYNSGDLIIFNTDVAASTTITTNLIDKYDHTQSEDTVLLNETQTLTNKTISASSNTISNLGTSNFASGVINTAIAASPSDTSLLTEKAINTALGYKAPLASPALTGTPTAPTATAGTNTTQIATTAFVTTAVSNGVSGFVKKEKYNNPSLTPTDGVCEWTISHTLGTKDVQVQVFENATGTMVWMSGTAVSTTSFKLTFNASSSVAANTYYAILEG